MLLQSEIKTYIGRKDRKIDRKKLDRFRKQPIDTQTERKTDKDRLIDVNTDERELNSFSGKPKK